MINHFFLKRCLSVHLIMLRFFFLLTMLPLALQPAGFSIKEVKHKLATLNASPLPATVSPTSFIFSF